MHHASKPASFMYSVRLQKHLYHFLHLLDKGFRYFCLSTNDLLPVWCLDYLNSLSYSGRGYGGLSQFWVLVCEYIHNYLAVYGLEIIVQLRIPIHLARSFLILRVLWQSFI